jgi:hypothetical protein
MIKKLLLTWLRGAKLGWVALFVAAVALFSWAWMYRYDPGSINNGRVWDRWAHDLCTVKTYEAGGELRCLHDEVSPTPPPQARPEGSDPFAKFDEHK